jgi:hypothetical protein
MENHVMRTKEANLIPSWQTSRFRLLGLLPLCFFIARAIQYVAIAKTPEQMLWSCHVSNLMLAAGMFLGNPLLIRIAVFWQILGLPPWIYANTVESLWTKPETLVSIFSHLGGSIVAIIAIREIGAKRWSWVSSLIYFVILQQITRLVTDPGPYTNVNVAHFAYGPMKDWFAVYWKYWVVNTSVVAMTLILLEFVFLWLFPTKAKYWSH